MHYKSTNKTPTCSRSSSLSWSGSWRGGHSERHLMVGETAVAGDLTAEINSPRGRGFVCVFVHIYGRQLRCLREVASIVRGFVWQQPHRMHATPLEYDVSTRRHILRLLCVCHSKLPIDNLLSYCRVWAVLRSLLGGCIARFTHGHL